MNNYALNFNQVQPLSQLYMKSSVKSMNEYDHFLNLFPFFSKGKKGNIIIQWMHIKFTECIVC